MELIFSGTNSIEHVQRVRLLAHFLPVLTLKSPTQFLTYHPLSLWIIVLQYYMELLNMQSVELEVDRRQ